MLIDFEPGDYVTNPANKDWGLGQVQSIIGNKVTVNFENYGKRVINVENIKTPSGRGSHQYACLFTSPTIVLCMTK